jgi:transposase-like protein
MERIPPSQKIRQDISQLLSQGLEGQEDVLTTIVRLGTQCLVQEMLEQEVTDYLGREHYERRRPDEDHHGYRNGYEPGRMHTTEGEIMERGFLRYGTRLKPTAPD